jgi:hypothetical protein
MTNIDLNNTDVNSYKKELQTIIQQIQDAKVKGNDTSKKHAYLAMLIMIRQLLCPPV